MQITEHCKKLHALDNLTPSDKPVTTDFPRPSLIYLNTMMFMGPSGALSNNLHINAETGYALTGKKVLGSYLDLQDNSCFNTPLTRIWGVRVSL